MKYEPKMEKEIMCPIEYGLDMFGGKWKSRILCVLASADVMRYTEIRKELGNITDAVLAAMLKDLSVDDLVSREQFGEIPPRWNTRSPTREDPCCPSCRASATGRGSRQKTNWIKSSPPAKRASSSNYEIYERLIKFLIYLLRQVASTMLHS